MMMIMIQPQRRYILRTIGSHTSTAGVMAHQNASNMLNLFSTKATTSSPPPAAAVVPKPPPSAPVAAAGGKSDDSTVVTINPVSEQRETLSKMDRHLVYYNKAAEEQYLPAPVLPENVHEISLLDPSDIRHKYKMDGTKRTVIIRQEKKSMRQAPLNPESSWRIFFYEDGTSSERWTNSLMGWTSNADPYQFNPPITFSNAADAVYFAKKCNWNYIVKAPIRRYMRNDDAQYQDNFLKPSVAAELQKNGINTKEYQRSSAATSHYFRPLNYHGTAPVRQHGPTGTTQPVVQHVPGIYKQR